MKKIILLSFLLFLTSCSKTITEQSPEPLVYFTNNINMTNPLLELFNSAENSIHCAFYDFKINEAITTLDNKDIDVKIITNENRKDNGLMHNKFCIIDSQIVWTGSFNPTYNGLKNDNDIMILFSPTAANIYEKEFNELWKGKFKEGKKNRISLVMNNYNYEFLFCPEDNCANRIIKELDKANNSISFATFSFTHQEISDKLIEKNNQGVQVKGLFEKNRISHKYNKYEYLSKYIETQTDSNKYIMHHKFFIIDNKTLITGSFNPTNNGDKNNDENIIITNNPYITERYVNHFFDLYQNN